MKHVENARALPLWLLSKSIDLCPMEMPKPGEDCKLNEHTMTLVLRRDEDIAWCDWILFCAYLRVLTVSPFISPPQEKHEHDGPAGLPAAGGGAFQEWCLALPANVAEGLLLWRLLLRAWPVYRRWLEVGVFVQAKEGCGLVSVIHVLHNLLNLTCF